MASETEEPLRISGRVADQNTRQGIEALRVEAWDKDLIVEEPIAAAVTDQQGSFTLEFQLGDTIGERQALLFFKVFHDADLITTTQDSLLWSVESPDQEIIIEIESSGSPQSSDGDGDTQRFTVRGVITRQCSGIFSNGVVRAFDQDVVTGTPLGDTLSDAGGNYLITYTVGSDGSAISRNPNLIIGAFDDQQRLLGKSDVRPNAGPQETINFEIPMGLPSVSNVDVTYTVEGRVLCPDRAGVGGLCVQIVDKNVGADFLLAGASTDERGNYKVSFTSTSLRQRGKKQPDLQARVYAGQTFLAASMVRYNATTTETLDVRLPANSAALPSEYETLVGAVATHYSGRLDDLKESDDRQDITYLANKTGWDARAVALAALAEQFSQRVNKDRLPPALFYALFRAGLPANEETLYDTDTGTLAAIWNKAAEQGVIPQSMTQSIPEAVEQFRVVSVEKLLTGPALVGASSLKQMLTVSLLDDAQQARFADLYTLHRNDMPKFWDEVRKDFGDETANRLQLDGKLEFLTINNAPLTQAIHNVTGGITDPLQLAQLGYHTATRWATLLTSSIPIPNEIPGETLEARRTNYAEYLAAQVRLSYPTASVAQMVKSGHLRLNGASPGASDQVHSFLTEHQGKFEIGIQPVQQYVARNNLQVGGEIVTQIERLQRVYQITPGHEAMTRLINREIDSAYQVVRYDKEEFVKNFQGDLGGAQAAALTYDKSLQVHNTVLNLAISYLTARNGIGPGTFLLNSQQATDQPQPVTQPTPNAAVGENASDTDAPASLETASSEDQSGPVIQPAPTGTSDVIAYPTLETLFGELDFCACDHCRSVLSPAAYLVDLLSFIDRPAAGTGNPQAVLFSRRPDIQHLPLTCENTNTAMPYIDVVNETLEYFIANNVQRFSLHGYVGHDTAVSESADLLASPQFVMDSAYSILKDEPFPPPLPFHQPLENLRRYFEKFEVPLSLSMERFRKSDALERGSNPYGWRDILMEELRLSRAENGILTGSSTTSLQDLYGFPDGTTNSDVIIALSNAKEFTRLVGITYENLDSILQTRFVNPNSDLIPKLERLRVPFTTLKALKDGMISDDDFDELLPTGATAPDPAVYGGDIKAWIKNDANFSRIMGLITLINPTGNPDLCNFDLLEFRFSNPMTDPSDTSTRLGAVEFYRLIRFIRLWKKMGWTIPQTDAAICALYRADFEPLGAGDVDTLAKLDSGFSSLLPRLGVVVRVMKALNLKPKRDLLSLLACWSDIGTHGENALYRQMFLNPAMLRQDAVFADNGFGEFLADGTKKVAQHAQALWSAFNLTGNEYESIVAALGYDADTELSVSNISAIYRRGYLARKLKISVRELLLLSSLTGLDPFATLDAADPAIVRLITLIQAMKDRAMKSAGALYLIWNQDLSGMSAPASAQVIEFARTLRGDFVGIEDELTATEDPGGDIARARMTLVYGTEETDAFFALLDDTVILDVAYFSNNPTQPTLPPVPDSKISYDDFRHRLSHAGLMTAEMQAYLKKAYVLDGLDEKFENAVDALFARSEEIKGAFFVRHPELQSLFDEYIASSDPVADKRIALLAAFRPELSRRRKCQQALQRLSAVAGIDLTSTQALLAPASNSYPLHAAGHLDQPALNDVLALETPGLAVQLFFQETATGTIALDVPAAANLDYYYKGSNPLPANPVLDASVSGIWSGHVETPEAGFYNFIIEADAEAKVTLTLDGQPCWLTQNGNIYRNTYLLELKAGTLYEIELTVENVKERLSIKWETPKRAREVIPSRYLYPPTILAPFTDVYVRFLKTASLAVGLGLTAAEIAHFATHSDYQISGDGWLNTLPVSGDPTYTVAAALLKPLRALLNYSRIKGEISPDDERLLLAIEDPSKATANTDSLLFTLTYWDSISLNDLLAHFGSNIAGMTHFDQFRRVYDAFALIKKMGISANAVIEATTNEPTGDTVRHFQTALLARYENTAWRDVVQPINDSMRGLQRDALVSYILHQMFFDPATEHINTADKLFEYFLMDVQMEPCMQTSRIRHALSSVQLFIERCLMNLETDVSPASIVAKQWGWMKRYRVWEANRKVFLFPENWAEPELRDDQSPFFKEMMSELLQGDVTEEKAAVALSNYLSKLEEVAKLEPCGIHYVENNSGYHDDVAHVVARTSGANREYFYRKREFGYWTPWEQIKLDIEDDPVIPVVWNGRLFLFWLRIIKQALLDPSDLPTSSTAAGTFDQLTLADIKADAKSSAIDNLKESIQAVLCWSEFFNGKWQATRTSDIADPLILGYFYINDFYRPRLKLSAFFPTTKALQIIVSYDVGRGASFLLYNANNPPELKGDKTKIYFEPERLMNLHYSLKIDYPIKDISHTILTNDLTDQTVSSHHPASGKPWDMPFFYGDSRHVFYVTTGRRPVHIPDTEYYGRSTKATMIEANIPPLVLPPIKTLPYPTGPVDKQMGFGVINPSPIELVISEDANILQGIGTVGTVLFGEKQIGPSGSMVSTTQKV